MINRLKKAFTMAEVLMVLAVIGVVAAMTLPRLSDNVDEQALVAGVRKAYSDLQIAYDAMVTRYGEPDGWLSGFGKDSTKRKEATELLKNRLKESLDVDLDCGDSDTGCMSTSITDAYYLKLKSGTGLAISIAGDLDFTCSDFQDKYYPCAFGNIYVDVNGPDKGPNQDGYDIFDFVLSANGVEPEGLSYASGIYIYDDIPNMNTAWAIKAGNLDYNKCFSDLSWANKRTCN
ncbi:MAG: hypothetical protein DKM23_01565 [Candidatus Melainabacteria bacterium]|nr:MAG: hypothetical protein DKM23_01565 [Candidatus Melainabacteria bacterium]